MTCAAIVWSMPLDMCTALGRVCITVCTAFGKVVPTVCITVCTALGKVCITACIALGTVVHTTADARLVASINDKLGKKRKKE